VEKSTIKTLYGRGRFEGGNNLTTQGGGEKDRGSNWKGAKGVFESRKGPIIAR